MSVFLDANILFSASNNGSNLYRLLQWLKGRETLVTSRHAMMEAERNIILKRPDWQEYFQKLVLQVALVPEATLRDEVVLSEKDKPILGAAIAAGCAYLVTGDKRDFGHLYGRTVGGARIVSVLELTEIMLKKHQA